MPHPLTENDLLPPTFQPDTNTSHKNSLQFMQYLLIISCTSKTFISNVQLSHSPVAPFVISLLMKSHYLRVNVDKCACNPITGTK